MKCPQMIGLGELVNGLYRLKVQATTFPAIHSVSSSSNFFISCNNVVSETYIPMSALWHLRLGHLSNDRLYHMTSLYPSISCDNKSVCDICHFAKQRKFPFNISLSHATSKFKLLHFDTWGPLSICSVHGHKYFLTIVDDFNRYVWIILLKAKLEVSQHVQNFITMIEN